MKLLLAILVLVCLHQDAAASYYAVSANSPLQSGADGRQPGRAIENEPAVETPVTLRTPLPRMGGSYFGAQLGLIGSGGLRLRHISSDSAGPGVYIDAEADIGLWTEARVGAGTYLTRNLYIGAKFGAVNLFDTFQGTLAGLELGYTIPLTASRNWIMNIDAGIAHTVTSSQIGPSAPKVGIMPHNVRLCFQARIF